MYGVVLALAIAGTASPAQSLKSAKNIVVPRPQTSVSAPVRQSIGKVSTTQNDVEYREAVSSPILGHRTPKVVDAVQARLPGIEVGFTYYDFQTNGAMSNRLAYYADGPDKYVQMVWMTSKDSTRDLTTRIPGFAGNNRGTHYTFLEVSAPDAPALGIEDWQRSKRSEPDGHHLFNMLMDSSVHRLTHRSASMETPVLEINRSSSRK